MLLPGIDSLAKFSQQTVLLLKAFLLFKMILHTFLFHNSKTFTLNTHVLMYMTTSEI